MNFSNPLKKKVGAPGFEPGTFGSQIRNWYFVMLLVFLVYYIFLKICRHTHFLVLACYSGCFLLP
jgi:hypothetical protein